MAAIEDGGQNKKPHPPSITRSPSSATALDAIADGLSRDLPQVDWRNGTDGVLDAPWAADPAVLPDLLPIAIAGKGTALHGDHRAATFAAATDTQLRALGIPDADIPAIRAGLDRSPHHAAHAIEGAFTCLDPHSETARAAQAELASSDPSSSYDGSGSSSPTVTRLPDGTFRVDDAEGNEIGTALDAGGVQRLVDIQRATIDEGHCPPINRESSVKAGAGNPLHASSEANSTQSNTRSRDARSTDRNSDAAPIAPAANRGKARGMSMHGGTFSSYTNRAGGEVWTSTGNICQIDVGTLIYSALYKGEIHVISGVHGYPSGEFSVHSQFYQDDLKKFGNFEEVTIYNLPDLSSQDLSNLLQKPGTVIGAFCNSGPVFDNLSQSP